MLGFWIALWLVVAGVLGTMAYYALKVRQQRRPSPRVEGMYPPQERTSERSRHGAVRRTRRNPRDH
jgi:hypothetical protein